MPNLPLSGIRVVDLSHSWAAPHCTRMLADFGAEVIKVEYPRRLCILRGAKKSNRNYNRQPGWHQVNRNKLGIILDLKVDKDRNILVDLVKVSDVVVENSRSMVLDRLGFGYSDLVRFKKDIIVLSMSAFGHSGPFSNYAGYGAVFESVSGMQNLTAYKEGEKPQRTREVDVTNGVAGAGAVMTALIHRQMTGQGQHIDLSQLEAATHAALGEHLLEYSANGTHMPITGNRHRNYAPQGCYRCSGNDKWIAITIRTEEEWVNFCQITGHSDWVENPRFADRIKRRQNHDELDGMIESWTKERDRYEVMHLLQKAGIPAGAVLDMVDLSRNSHLLERQYYILSNGENGEKFMGMPFQFSETKGRIKWGGPDLGKHNEYVYSTILNRSAEEIETPGEEDIGTAFDVD